MNSSPWLAVAVYERAPVAEAPIATDIAANSDSTLMNSHGASSPVFTSCESASTMCVCGEMGYAAITSGRQQAIVSATAREPSSCLGIDGLQDECVGGRGGGDVRLRQRRREPVADRGGDGVERDELGDSGQGAEQRGVRQRPPEVLARDLRRRHGDDGRVELAEPELVCGAGAVEEHAPAG